MGKEDILKYLKNNKKYFEEKYSIVKLGLFGSYANNTQNDNSDIDLIVEFGSDTSNLFGKKQELKALMKSAFGKEIDICREKYIKPYFRNMILSNTIYV